MREDQFTMAMTTRPYHHGDLYRALILAAERVLAERGVAGMTLREVARQAGVSHNAPYNHFADKADLIAALVKEGFERFAQALRSTYESTSGQALDKVLATGVAYVLFARQQPALFRLMFRPELRCPPGESVPISPEDVGEDDAFRVVLDGLAQCQQEGSVPQGDSMVQALAAWSLVHGLAELMLDGPVGAYTPTEDATATMAREILTTFRFGLQSR